MPDESRPSEASAGDPMTVAEFEEELVQALSDELRYWRRRLASDLIRGFNLGCYPWFGYLELSFLTANEEDSIPPRVDQGHGGPIFPEFECYEGLATWRWFGFQATWDQKWPRGRNLLEWLRWLSSQPESRAPISNHALWRLCARAVNSPRVREELSAYNLAPEFVCSVFDPDDCLLENYCLMELRNGPPSELLQIAERADKAFSGIFDQ